MKVKVKSLIRVRLFATPWTVAHQAPPSMEFSRQEYWSGLPFPSLGDHPNLGIERRSLIKAMVYPVVMYGYESWTLKKAECQRIDAFELRF